MNERGPSPERAHPGDPEGWFPADVTLLDTSTGERRTYATWEALYDGEGFSDFVWVDGNFACDCNRYLFFQYASGRNRGDIADGEGPCGDSRFRVESIVDARDGRVVYSEEAKA